MDDTDRQHPVLIEFADRPGLRQVSSLSSPEVVQKSGKALQDAMGMIREVAEHVRDTVESMAERPSKVSVGFGIKFDAEASAFIAKARTEASVTVTLDWSSTPSP